MYYLIVTIGFWLRPLNQPSISSVEQHRNIGTIHCVITRTKTTQQTASVIAGEKEIKVIKEMAEGSGVDRIPIHPTQLFEQHTIVMPPTALDLTTVATWFVEQPSATRRSELTTTTTPPLFIPLSRVQDLGHNSTNVTKNTGTTLIWGMLLNTHSNTHLLQFMTCCCINRLQIPS